MYLKIWLTKYRQFCDGPNVVRHVIMLSSFWGEAEIYCGMRVLFNVLASGSSLYFGLHVFSYKYATHRVSFGADE